MTYSPTGWHAVFTAADGSGAETYPVECFDAEGRAMIMPRHGTPHGLRSVSDVERGTIDRKLLRLERETPIHSAIPAAPGWRVRYEDADGTYTRSIAAWLVHQDGTLEPVAGSNDETLRPAAGEILAPEDDDDPGLTQS